MTLYDMRHKWPTATREQRASAELTRACDHLRTAIAEASTVAEAYAIAQALAPIAQELINLTTRARERANELLEAC